MFETVVVVFERASCVIRRIDIDALHLPAEFLFKRLQCEKIVPKDESVIEPIISRPSKCRVIGFLWVVKEDSGLQARPDLLVHPDEF